MTFPLLTIDFETRSTASIKDLGSRLYAQHPSTEVVCGAFAWLEGDTYETHTVTPPAPGWGIEWPFGDVGEFVAIAHNHHFDARVWERLRWPNPVRWIDTSELARRAGTPQASLEWLAENFLGEAKDMAGNALTKSLSKPWEAKKPPKKPPHGWAPEPPRRFALDPIPADVSARVVEYCALDALLTARLFHEHLASWDSVSDLEDAVLAADRRINERGVHFDADLARVLLEVDDALAAKALADAGIDAPTSVRSNVQFIARMAALGVYIDNAQKATVEPLLEHEDERVALLAAARLGENTIAGGKLKSGLLKQSPDGTVKDLLRYIGAHTWRWSGVNPQPQNLPKG